MTALEWVMSGLALIWLGACAWFDHRSRRVPNLWWTAVPAVVAIAYRALAGPIEPALAAALAIAVSERRAMKAPWPALTLAGGGLVYASLIAGAAFAGSPEGPLLAVAAVGFFWLSWECGWIGGADAMALMVSILLWPSYAWLIAYLCAGAVWSLILRLRHGGWARWHPIPGLVVVATACVFYLGYRAVWPG